ncbi:hypothetical protein RCL1_002324 [Eukaryota sp. TZLM3-RCL]
MPLRIVNGNIVEVPDDPRPLRQPQTSHPSSPSANTPIRTIGPREHSPMLALNSFLSTLELRVSRFRLDGKLVALLLVLIAIVFGKRPALGILLLLLVFNILRSGSFRTPSGPSQGFSGNIRTVSSLPRPRG